jgi:hypothetical protein
MGFKMDLKIFLFLTIVLLVTAYVVISYSRKRDAIIKADLLARIEKMQSSIIELRSVKHSLSSKINEYKSALKVQKEESFEREQRLRNRISVEVRKFEDAQKE